MPELRQERLTASAAGDFRSAVTIGAGHHKGAGTQSRNAVFRPLRRMPPQVAYEWRARTYPWAIAMLKTAEQEHGAPTPAPVGRPRKDGTAPQLRSATSPERCEVCGYLLTSPGHLIQCGGQS